MSFTDFYLQLDTLTSNITEACNNENYQYSDKLVAQRLVLLQTLASKLAVFGENSPEKEFYYKYLQELKIKDDKQILKLIAVKAEESEIIGQRKRKKKAINTYKKFT